MKTDSNEIDPIPADLFMFLFLPFLFLATVSLLAPFFVHEGGTMFFLGFLAFFIAVVSAFFETGDFRLTLMYLGILSGSLLGLHCHFSIVWRGEEILWSLIPVAFFSIGRILGEIKSRNILRHNRLKSLKSGYPNQIGKQVGHSRVWKPDLT